MKVAVVVPTVEGRGEYLDRCIGAYNRPELGAEIEVTVMADYPSCGSAWIAGMESLNGGSRPDYVHFTADDLEPHAGWLEPAVECVERGWLPCPLVFNPDGSLQSAGISGWDVYTGEYEDWSAIAATTVPFMSWEQWEHIGMTDLHYCSDMWVSYVGRKFGWETRLRTAFQFTHHNAPRENQHGRTVYDRQRFLERVTTG